MFACHRQQIAVFQVARALQIAWRQPPHDPRPAARVNTIEAAKRVSAPPAAEK